MMIEDEANGNVIPNYSPTQSVSTTSESSTQENFPLGTSPNNTSPQKKKPVEFETKKLNRGISRATDNVNLVSQARSEIIVDSSSQECCLETPLHTFALPDLTGYPDDFRTFLEKDLIAVSTQISLEQANRLNWWTSYCQRLWPLSTSGDGNCLLHAASLGMWGFHDRLLTLRKTLHAFLTQSPRKDALWRRWRRQQSLLNAQSGLMYSEVEWRQEWNAIVNMASSEPRLRRLSIQSEPGSENTSGNIYESLEEIHVLALAHVLKRPIVVVADTVLKDMNGEALAPIPFGGIYLPLECLPSECHRSPLLLAYDGGHFSALVSMDSPLNGLSSAIPLTDMSGELLPIQFSIDPGPNGNESECSDLSHGQSIDLLTSYLDLVRLDSQNSSPTDESKNSIFGSIGKSVGAKLKLKLSRNNSQRQSKTILCAVLHLDKRPEYHETMVRNYLETAELRFKMSQENKMESEEGVDVGLRYNAGNSHFYTEADTESHEKVLQLSPVKPPLNMDSTLYLSNSTFYEPPSQKCLASQCPFFGNPQTQNYCSKCFKELFCPSA